MIRRDMSSDLCRGITIRPSRGGDITRDSWYSFEEQRGREMQRQKNVFHPPKIASLNIQYINSI